jgi:hypothetical protein
MRFAVVHLFITFVVVNPCRLARSFMSILTVSLSTVHGSSRKGDIRG